MDLTSIIIVSVLLIIYVMTISIFNKGLRLVFTPSASEAINLKVSIVIAAKNEERNVEGLIRALDKLDYPKDQYEVIIVDDNSRDSTAARIKTLISDKSNIKLISTTDTELPPKKGALALGIEQTQNDFIMITDADCTPLPGWIKSFVNKFRDGHDFLIGLAPFHQQKNSDLNSFICFENLRTSLLTMSAAGLGMPFSGTSRSFGFKKEAFNKIEGYKNTLQTLGGDDDLLLQEAVKNNMSVGTVTDLQGMVYSNTPFTFSDYSRQKKRHLKTSHHYILKNKFIVGYWHLINTFFFLSILITPFSIYFLAPFLLKMLIDYTIVKKRQSLLAYSFNDPEIPILQVLYELLVVYNFFNSLTPLRKWK